MKQILIINGPNLGLLGTREVEKYGSKTLHDLENELLDIAKNRAKLIFFQSDIEGEIVSFIGKNYATCDGIVINAAAYTHTSVALLDALRGANKPYIEVHITNVHAREAFRHQSFIAGSAVGVIAGLGFKSYAYALEYFINQA